MTANVYGALNNLDWLNVKSYGAKGDGLNDDTSSIQAALNACPAGGIVYLPAGVYRTSGSLVLPPAVTLMGSHSNMMVATGLTNPQCFIQPLPSFSGVAVIRIEDASVGGYLTTPAEHRIFNLMIDGSSYSATSIDGIQAKGNIQNVVMRSVTIRYMTGNGIYTDVDAGAYPYSWRLYSIMVDNCHGHGYSFNRMTDITLDDCQAIGCWANGFQLTNLPNSQMIACRAEWNGNHGYYLTGSWGTGQGSGGMQMTGCSTDRNGWNGVYVDATGNGPIVISGLMTRRDGRNGNAGGGGYAGLAANGTTMPLTIGDWTNYPGTDDDGTGTNSPQYGASFTNNTLVQVDNAYLHAATAALHNGGGNTTLQCRNMTYATGATTSPTRTVAQTSALGWISVKDPAYGAVGDGVTDDTAAIQAAINAVSSVGGTVYFPAGRYLLNGASGLSVATAATTLVGESAEATKILIGSGFTASAAVSITAYNCQIRDLSINGNSSTTTSNPVCNAIEITAVRRAKVLRCQFWYINGWAIEAAATTASGTSNPFGTQLGQLFMQSCAGGIHFLGNTTQGYAINSQISDVQFYSGGVTTGASANLDGIRIEDSWDVLTENAIVWMSAGTGSSFHVKGNCAATFTTNLDALGPSGAPCVLVEDGTNGSPQNTQFTGGVIQQGTPGLLVSGGAYQTHVSTVRIISNQTHGIQVATSGKPVHVYNSFFNLNGAGAAGTNYDLNWSGTGQGKVLGCWFGSNIVATGSAGVQQSINIATAGQAVLVEAAAFQGSGASSANWFTNLPAGVIEASSGALNFPTTATFSGSTAIAAKGNIAAQPSASGNTVMSINVNGADAFDRVRMLGTGEIDWGPGTATRDTKLYRSGVGALQTDGFFAMGSGQSGGTFNVFGSLAVGTAGQTLSIKEGTNAKMGVATLTAGAATVATTAVTATSRIQLTSQADGGTPGWLRVDTRTAGTSFHIQSSSASDTSTVAWVILEPA